jgi:hypothetical protein
LRFNTTIALGIRLLLSRFPLCSGFVARYLLSRLAFFYIAGQLPHGYVTCSFVAGWGWCVGVQRAEKVFVVRRLLEISYTNTIDTLIDNGMLFSDGVQVCNRIRFKVSLDRDYDDDDTFRVWKLLSLRIETSTIKRWGSTRGNLCTYLESQRVMSSSRYSIVDGGG